MPAQENQKFLFVANASSFHAQFLTSALNWVAQF